MPVLDGSSCPLRRLVGMAIVTSVGRTELDGQIGPRDTEAMIVPPVDPHISARGHMTGDAPERRAHRLMAVMCDRRILIGSVALSADAVTWRPKFGAMRLMAIAARHAGCEHLTLLE